MAAEEQGRRWIVTTRRAVEIGLAVGVALGFFVPNCTCRNPVNAWWIASLGRSPACYVSGVGVFLIASTALVTRRRVVSAALLAWGVVAATLAFWVGHHYFNVPW